MTPPTAEPSEVAPSAAVVVDLLRAQLPHLADLPVRASPTAGSSNWVFRLGDHLAVRLPVTDDYVADLFTEIRWLPHIAPDVASAVPEVVGVGEPSVAFPRPWAVVSWLDGELPVHLDEAQQTRFATSLGAFVTSLHAVDTAGAPHGAEHWGYRCGEPVTDRVDGWVVEASAELAELFDPVRVQQAWQRLRRVPPHTQPRCWVHTDLSAENLLVHDDGRLAGVIDFGGMGIGDRSVDLLYAWSMLDAPAREVLRVAAEADEATWSRARAWAFVGPGLLTVAHYRDSMPARTERLIGMLRAVADEVDVRL